MVILIIFLCIVSVLFPVLLIRNVRMGNYALEQLEIAGDLARQSIHSGDMDWEKHYAFIEYLNKNWSLVLLTFWKPIKAFGNSEKGVLIK